MSGGKNLVEILNKLDNLEKNNIILSYHAGIRASQRGISQDELFHLLIKGQKEAIVSQQDNVYKLLIIYNSNTDLNIILKIKNNKVYIITVFKSNIQDRLKNEKTR